MSLHCSLTLVGGSTPNFDDRTPYHASNTEAYKKKTALGVRVLQVKDWKPYHASDGIKQHVRRKRQMSFCDILCSCIFTSYHFNSLPACPLPTEQQSA